MVLEKILESPLTCKEIKPVNPKGNQSWIFIGRTDAEAEAPVLWPPDAKSWLIGKDPDAGRDWWGQEEKGTTEDEMAAWHHRLNAHEFGYTPGVGDGQGGLAFYNSWGRKELDMTKQLNWLKIVLVGMKVRGYIWYLGIKLNSIVRKLDGEMRKGDKTTHLGFAYGKIAQWQVHFSICEDKRKRNRCGKEDHFGYI